MAAELQAMETRADQNAKKRKSRPGKGKKSNKMMKPKGGAALRDKKPSKKMMKLFHKRARAYNSDEEDEAPRAESRDSDQDLDMDGGSGDDEEPNKSMDPSKGYSGSDDEEEGRGYGVKQRVTKFTDGCRAFRTAFSTIMKKSLPKDPLGPVLSGNKKLIAEKLAEEEGEVKAKGDAKKERHSAAEKGHIKPASYLDAKEKFLIGVATKGAVKLFNAVNKAQIPQKGFNPSKSKDARALARQRKQTFLSELKKTTVGNLENPTFNSSKVSSVNKTHDDEPGWAPLRDSYMMTSSKLKDWDKMEDSASFGGHSHAPSESSSDEE